jgi:hypothetical protein
MHVINYDLPSMDHDGIDEYVHRIGMFFVYHLDKFLMEHLQVVLLVSETKA